MVRNKKKKKEITKTQKVLKVIMWTCGILTLVPYLIFAFSYPSTKLLCSYLKGYCFLQPSIALDVSRWSFQASYYAWWFLAPTALLCGLIYAGILFVKQIKNS
jgi:hypothetical protein